MVLDRARVLIGSAIKTRRDTCPHGGYAIKMKRRPARAIARREARKGRTADMRLMRANGKEKERNGGKQGGEQLPTPPPPPPPPRRLIESADTRTENKTCQRVGDDCMTPPQCLLHSSASRDWRW